MSVNHVVRERSPSGSAHVLQDRTQSPAIVAELTSASVNRHFGSHSVVDLHRYSHVDPHPDQLDCTNNDLLAIGRHFVSEYEHL